MDLASYLGISLESIIKEKEDTSIPVKEVDQAPTKSQLARHQPSIIKEEFEKEDDGDESVGKYNRRMNPYNTSRK